MLCDAPFEDHTDLEELVRAGGDCPALSRGLRERIIADAVTARALVVRQSQRGRAGVVLAMSFTLAMLIGRPALPVPMQAESIASSDELEKMEHSLIQDEQEFVSSPSDSPDQLDWKQVEFVSHLRRQNANLLRSALGS